MSSKKQRYSVPVLPLIAFVILVGALGFALWPSGNPAAPPVRPQPPVIPSPTVATPATSPDAPEPEEGSSVRRVRWADVTIDPAPPDPGRLVTAGKAAYEQHCLVCHGKEGKGDGPAADLVLARPRNFTRAMFKFKSSIPEEVPFDDDLYRTISSGIPAGGMPSFGDLTPFERWALVAYLKTLSQIKLDDGTVLNFFERRTARTRMKFATPPGEAILDKARAEKMFRSDIGCGKCHGNEGLGNGPSAEDMVDSLDFPIKPADLTRGEVSFKAGHRVEDIYRVMTTGMAGTPMPAFSTISDEERWQLAYYVVSLYKPIDPGERVYLRVGCTSCHTIGKGKMIGPDLAGVVQRRDKEWLKKWLKDPPSMLATDPTARQLMEEYLTPMPSYGLTTKEVDLLIRFMEGLPPATPAKQDK